MIFDMSENIDNFIDYYENYPATAFFVQNEPVQIVWVGIIFDEETQLVLDCKWYMSDLSDEKGKEALIDFSKDIVGLTYSKELIRQLPFDLT